MADDGGRFTNDDEAAQHWLGVLRDGSPEQKIAARSALAQIFERRGMLEEATDLLVSNVREGFKNVDIFRWLARLYRAQGDEVLAMQAAAEAAKYMPPATPVAPVIESSPATPIAVMPVPSRPQVPARVEGGRRVCPACNHRNAITRLTCKQCGAALVPDARVVERSGARSAGRRPSILKVGGLVIAGLIGLCVLGSVANMSAGRSTSQQAGAPTSTLSSASQPAAAAKPAAEKPAATSTSVPTPWPPTATPAPPTSTPVPPTATPRPDPAQARYIDPRELVAEPKTFVGQNILLQGKALNVTHNEAQKGILTTTEDHTWVQLLAVVRGRNTTESVVVEFYPRDTKLLKDECYRIFGVVTGTQTVRRTLTGAQNEAPVVRGYSWQSSPAGQYGGCAAP